MKNSLVFKLGQLTGQLNDSDDPYYYVQKTLNKLSTLPDKRGVIAYNFNKFGIHSGTGIVQSIRHKIATRRGHQLLSYERNTLFCAENYVGTWIYIYYIRLSDGSKALSLAPVTAKRTLKLINSISHMYLSFKRNDLDESMTKILVKSAIKTLTKKHKPCTHSNIAKTIDFSIPF